MLFATLLAFTLLPTLVVSAPAGHQRMRRRFSCPKRSLSSNIPTPTSDSNNNQPHHHKTTSTAAQPKATPDNNSDTLGGLFPLGQFAASWSMNPDANNSLPLSDSAMGAFKVVKALAHPVVKAPDGQEGMQVHFPKGEWGFGHDPAGGVSFYANGPSDFDMTTAKEATLGYRIYFDEGYDFNKGGKLPGLYGGDSQDVSTSCSGGRIASDCFSSRFMWRTDGAGEIYAYLPPHTNPEFRANKAICNVKPFSVCNDEFGSSIGRGAFHFKPGQWNTIAQRVRLNDPGQANGELEAFINGKSVIKVGGIIIRQGDQGRIRGLQVQSFFGGSDDSWASPQDQNIYFSDWSVTITEKL